MHETDERHHGIRTNVGVHQGIYPLLIDDGKLGFRA
jgi:hypothetical protein